ncbi:type II toxin-antitoxin system PemK/MazF family toxin [Conexibacter sp. CPCC 206217]|uniref:type II toxin-antitoxin system PemK/MazF family toxin n=1 Tax=Conexibacter sp. CPCC 206217 TaxID=3064574 RepID=UPI002727584A|nr:type II toxin-antitoxin system PemK/MazF family toxin [Conexibacter sp. CPCC 206217]MDO8213986.1 type II toxin-antitoxin system PemK/MazF family toxin [Conexibacter sp. CPCC 206217]
MRRGEVWWVDFGLPRGSAPALRRPALIVSADAYNRSNLKTVTVAVITTNARLARLPGNVTIPSEATRLPKDSVVNVTQMATVDRGALEQQIDTLPEWLMAQVDDGLQRALALGRA